MKKNRKSGYNGSLRPGIDIRARPNIGGDCNRRQGKINGFVSGMFGARKSISNSDINTAYVSNGSTPASTIQQDVENTSHGYFTFIRGGVDYFMDNRNTLTLSGNFARGVFKNDELNQMEYDTFYIPVKEESAYRKTMAEGFFRNYGGTVSFKHNFAKSGHEWTADVNLNSSKSNNDAQFFNQFYNADNTQKGLEQKQLTDGGSNSTFWVIQTDYSNPITDKIKIDAGLRGQIRDFSSKNLNYLYHYVIDDFILNEPAS